MLKRRTFTTNEIVHKSHGDQLASALPGEASATEIRLPGSKKANGMTAIDGNCKETAHKTPMMPIACSTPKMSQGLRFMSLPRRLSSQIISPIALARKGEFLESLNRESILPQIAFLQSSRFGFTGP
jgi:hypothetical protein